MADSLQSLKNQLREKERELQSIGGKISSAGFGASLASGSPLGTAAKLLLGKDKDKQKQIERDISTLNDKIRATERQIDDLNRKESAIINEHQTNKARLEAKINQARNDLERQRQNEQDPNLHRELDNQLMRQGDDARNQERQLEQQYEQSINSVRQEIHRLTF